MSKFFDIYRQHQQFINKVIEKKVIYQASSPVRYVMDLEEAKSYVMMELHRVDYFTKTDPSIPEFLPFLHNKIYNILIDYSRVHRRSRRKILGEADCVSAEEMSSISTEGSFSPSAFFEDRLGYTNHEGELDKDLVEELGQVLNDTELKYVLAVSEDGIKGSEMVKVMGMDHPVQISRLRKRIQSKIRSIMVEYGLKPQELLG